jgi:TRAP-type C4-dicarboxylate transport system permease small subunit
MNGLPAFLVVLSNALVLAFGVLITHTVISAARRTGSAELHYLGVGFGLVTLGLLFGGGTHALVGDVMYGVAARAILTSLGFGFVLYALRRKDRHRTRAVRTAEQVDDRS